MNGQQFGDLPMIPHSMDESNYFAWGLDHVQHTSTFRNTYGSTRAEEGAYHTDLYENGMVMGRFMQDQYPLAPGLLLNVPVLHSHDQQYELHYPNAEYHRQVSPCSSGQSGDASQTEFRSPHTYYPTASYGSPKDIFPPQIALPCPTTENFPEEGYMSQTSLHGGCNLRDLQYNPEPVMEDDDTNMKEETPVDPVVVPTTKVEAAAEEPHEYADSGIGNSVRDAESVQPIDMDEDEDSDDDYRPTSSRSTKRRRSSASNSSSSSKTSKRRGSTRKDSPASSTTSVAKVTKKSRSSPGSKTVRSKIPTDNNDERRFPCPLAEYGCQSDFSSKNEWKRHVSTQHIKLGYWRCELCQPTTDPQDDTVLYYNDFNRKDLFAQHLRRMHGSSNKERNPKAPLVTDDNLADFQIRCLKQLRKPPPQSRCLFCEKTFSGPSSWEERMEHVGKHLEKDYKKITDMLDHTTWHGDINLEDYLIEEGIIIKEQGRWKIGDGKPKRLLDGMSDSEEE